MIRDTCIHGVLPSLLDLFRLGHHSSNGLSKHARSHPSKDLLFRRVGRRPASPNLDHHSGRHPTAPLFFLVSLLLAPFAAMCDTRVAPHHPAPPHHRRSRFRFPARGHPGSGILGWPGLFACIVARSSVTSAGKTDDLGAEKVVAQSWNGNHRRPSIKASDAKARCHLHYQIEPHPKTSFSFSLYRSCKIQQTNQKEDAEGPQQQPLQISASDPARASIPPATKPSLPRPRSRQPSPHISLKQGSSCKIFAKSKRRRRLFFVKLSRG